MRRADEADPLTGARRDDVLIAPEDAERLHLTDGAAIRMTSAAGRIRGHAKLAPVAPGALQAHWPEANVLIGSRLDPGSHEPDYNAWVRLERA